MKIVPLPPKEPAKPVAESARDRRPDAAQASPTASADRVELSSLAAALHLEHIPSPTEADRPRLEALRNAIRNGTLKVDTEELAGDIVNEDLSWQSSAGGEGVR